MPAQQTIILPRGSDGNLPQALYVPNIGVVALLGAVLPSKQDSQGHQASSLTFAKAAYQLYLQGPGTVINASQNSGDLQVGQFEELALDINITATAGTTPTLQFTLERKGGDNVYYQVWQSASLTANGATSVSIGQGMSGTGGVALSFGSLCRLRWVIGGTASPSFTLSISMIGK